MVRPNTVLPLGNSEEGPEYDYADQVTFRVYDVQDEAAAEIYDMDQNKVASIVALTVTKNGVFIFFGCLCALHI